MLYLFTHWQIVVLSYGLLIQLTSKVGKKNVVFLPNNFLVLKLLHLQKSTMKYVIKIWSSMCIVHVFKSQF